MQKKLLPYLKRADELESREPLASFYCRLYVAEQLMKTRVAGDADTDAALIHVLDEAEKLKPSLGPDLTVQGPIAFQQFCRELFDAALEGESAGIEPTAAAMKYYFASLFLDVLTQFGELTQELEEMRTFARNKVVQLRRGGVVKWADVKAKLQMAREAADSEDAVKAKDATRAALELLG
jgi:vacuolar protein sorting-associated protein VTA1